MRTTVLSLAAAVGLMFGTTAACLAQNGAQDSAPGQRMQDKDKGSSSRSAGSVRICSGPTRCRRRAASRESPEPPDTRPVTRTQPVGKGPEAAPPLRPAPRVADAFVGQTRVSAAARGRRCNQGQAKRSSKLASKLLPSPAPSAGLFLAAEVSAPCKLPGLSELRHPSHCNGMKRTSNASAQAARGGTRLVAGPVLH